MIVNGEETALTTTDTSIKAYLENNGYAPSTVAVEKNGVIIPRYSFASETLSDGDKIEIVTFMGGG